MFYLYCFYSYLFDLVYFILLSLFPSAHVFGLFFKIILSALSGFIIFFGKHFVTKFIVLIIIILQDFRNYRYSLPMVPGLTVDLEAQRTCIKIPTTGYNEVRLNL